MDNKSAQSLQSPKRQEFAQAGHPGLSAQLVCCRCVSKTELDFFANFRFWSAILYVRQQDNVLQHTGPGNIFEPCLTFTNKNLEGKAINLKG
jgi:hypothetical protein